MSTEFQFRRLCDHGDKDWHCTVCCLAYLRQNLPRVEKAVRNRDKTSQGGGSSRPASGSREQINVGAFALLQDVAREGGTNGLERNLATLHEPERADTARLVRQFRSRCALVLKDALAPFPLTWDAKDVDENGNPIRNKPVLCPVVNENGDCGGQLYVHRDDQPTSPNYGKAAIIVCRNDDEHAWPMADGGWLRLGVLFGGVS